MEPKVATFFYGSYMNRGVLAEVEIAPDDWQPAKLAGYDLRIAPLANLIAAPDHAAYGVVAYLTHGELDRLYRHARDVLGGTYLPHPVVVELTAGGSVPALCYLAHDLPTASAAADYVERILSPARDLGFPASYLDRIATFLPRSG